ncbi:hypothetical protein PBF_05328 [Cytobacillus firmus DS1]|uniref:Uncharacterized protein n=1 Tax=Cytobacillus firmus DS1 TaxID=1307436 RepID=W7LJB2_CYTFI|nr:hypothetical protein PBF_05328 [Cytobacillus firmus DS1]
MWRRLHRDDKYKTSPARRCSFLLEGIGLCLESLGAETRQACDLEGVGAGARQFAKFNKINSVICTIKTGSAAADPCFLHYYLT